MKTENQKILLSKLPIKVILRPLFGPESPLTFLSENPFIPSTQLLPPTTTF